METNLGQLQWLEGELSFEDTWWKELGAMNFAQLGCCGTTYEQGATEVMSVRVESGNLRSV